jgi:NitT/TauT family transport system ATP-binding protein
VTHHKLQLLNISLEYSTVMALQDVSFEVNDGEFVSIVGPSGCGKSTLLSIIDGLIPATTGKTLLDGVEVSTPGNNRALVFQEASLLPWRTVLENVTFGLECKGMRRSQAEARAMNFIRLVGLDGFATSFPFQLSGGMQQRVNIARALAVDPEVLLMDEPFSALDAQTRDIMQSELLGIWQRTNKTVLFVTHQISEAIYLSDRIIVLSGRPGRVAEIISVDLPRPRDLSVKRTTAFLEYENRIWSLIQVEARRAATS